MYRTVCAVVVLATLAGCTDPDDGMARPPTSAECLEQGLILDDATPGGPACVAPPFEVRDFENPNHHCVVTKQRDRVHAPDLVGDPWVQGQWWEYSLAIDGEDRGTTRLVYYDDQDIDSAGIAQHYMVGTVTREEALRHAIHSENPMVGRVHRILYSPHESGDHADMFHFPLCPGSSWTTVFYGEMFTLTASNASIDVPSMGASPGFAIEGASSGGGRLALTYSPAAQWFTRIDLTRSDGGTVGLELVALGAGQTGPAYFLRAQQDQAIELAGTTPVPFFSGTVAEQAFEREDGGDGPYDTIGLGIVASLVGNGVAMLEVVDPAGEVAWTRSMGGQEPATIDTMAEVPYAAGTWTVRLNGFAVDPGAALVDARVQVVSIYDRSGTV